jgi:quinol monooxygenase YgiN
VLIIAGKLYVDPEYLEEYLASLEDVIRRARTQPGCLDCVIAADPVEAGRVNQFEQWESEEHFAS